MPPADETEEEKEVRLAKEAAEVAALERAIFANGGRGTKAASGGGGDGNGDGDGANGAIPEAAAAALMSGNWADTDDEEEQLRQVGWEERGGEKRERKKEQGHWPAKRKRRPIIFNKLTFFRLFLLVLQKPILSRKSSSSTGRSTPSKRWRGRRTPKPRRRRSRT